MKKTRKISDLLALVSFGVFALCTVLVLLTGARGYRSLVQSGTEGYERRTAIQYVTTRVRQAESVTVEDFGGCQSLTMTERLGEETYLTRVYCYEGHLRELYCGENAALSPADGERVLPLKQMKVTLEDSMLTVILDEAQIDLFLPLGKEAGR